MYIKKLIDRKNPKETTYVQMDWWTGWFCFPARSVNFDTEEESTRNQILVLMEEEFTLESAVNYKYKLGDIADRLVNTKIHSYSEGKQFTAEVLRACALLQGLKVFLDIELMGAPLLRQTLDILLQIRKREPADTPHPWLYIYRTWKRMRIVLRRPYAQFLFPELLRSKS